MEARKKQFEAQKAARAVKNRNLIFGGIKACLDKKEDEFIHEKIHKKVSTATAKLEDKTLISYLAASFTEKQETFMI